MYFNWFCYGRMWLFVLLYSAHVPSAYCSAPQQTADAVDSLALEEDHMRHAPIGSHLLNALAVLAVFLFFRPLLVYTLDVLSKCTGSGAKTQTLLVSVTLD